MKHPNPEIWSDFVRGVLGSHTATNMKTHLDEGCQRCEQQVSALEAVLRVAETDLRIEPPAFAVRSVKNLFRVQQLIEKSQERRLRLDLTFDSFLTPAVAGVRSAASSERHLVYESPDLSLEIQLRGGEAAAPLRVEGHIMNTDSSPMPDVPAFLLKGGRIYSQDLSGSLGEFRLLGESHTSPRLCLLIDDERLVEVELPGLLERDDSATH